MSWSGCSAAKRVVGGYQALKRLIDQDEDEQAMCSERKMRTDEEDVVATRVVGVGCPICGGQGWNTAYDNPFSGPPHQEACDTCEWTGQVTRWFMMRWRIRSWIAGKLYAWAKQIDPCAGGAQ